MTHSPWTHEAGGGDIGAWQYVSRPHTFLSFHNLGENRGSPRVWLESQRLSALGFNVGSLFMIDALARSVVLRASQQGTYQVAKRRAAGGERPIIDLANRALLAPLSRWEEIKVSGSPGLLEIAPSIRAFTIQRQRASQSPWRTLEIFAGGGTLSAAISQHPTLISSPAWRLRLASPMYGRQCIAMRCSFKQTCGVFILRNIRRMKCSSPRFRARVILCLVGRRNRLREKPELGDSGDLFLCIAHCGDALAPGLHL